MQSMILTRVQFNVLLAAAALQFPLRYPMVASVVTGIRDAKEVETNLTLLQEQIPRSFWVAFDSV
jgi:D-threo-aldose 1-dehydrogenase